MAGISEEALRYAQGQSSSAKQHIAHLDDLHEFDQRRLKEFLVRVPTLSGADRANRQTHAANDNEVRPDVIVARLRTRRLELVKRMADLTEAEIGAVATHPRLGQPLRLIDWAVFVADHDDHHLASARQAIDAAMARS